MQESNSGMQEQLANKLAQLKNQVSDHDKVAVEKVLEPFAEKIELLNSGGLTAELTTILEQVKKTADIEGVQAFARKSEYYDLLSGEFEFPLIRIAETRSDLLKSRRPWSKAWIGFRARFKKLDRATGGLADGLASVGYLVGMVVSGVAGGVLAIEISVILGALVIFGIVGGGITIPYFLLEDTIVIPNISNLAINGTETLKQKLLDCGFESRARIKGRSLNSLRITIQARYTPDAQNKLILK